MKKEEYPQLQLFDHILTTCEIVCDFCHKKDSIQCSETDDAIDYFYNEGWRGRTKCYCPKCAKKKLKNNN